MEKKDEVNEKFDITVELDLARNNNGTKLSNDARIRLQNVIDNPCQQTWEDTFRMVIGSDGRTTLWQALICTSKEFPIEQQMGSKWEVIPKKGDLIRALRFATH